MNCQTDKAYIQSRIADLERERDEHGKKFANNPAHAQCLARFANTINALRKELSSSSLVSHTAPTPVLEEGSPLQSAAELNTVAQKLRAENKEQESEAVKASVRTLVAKQLNETDGFDR